MSEPSAADSGILIPASPGLTPLVRPPAIARGEAIGVVAPSYSPREGQLMRGVKTEVDYTLAHVVREGQRLNIATPLCAKLLNLIHELESGQRKLDPKNYDEIRTAAAA